MKNGGHSTKRTTIRGSNMRIVNKMQRKCAISVDGERTLEFQNFAKFEVEYQGLDLIVDFEALMSKQNHFIQSD